MSSIKFVKLVSIIGDNLGDATVALQLFDGILAGKTKLDEDAKMFLEMDILLMNLRLRGATVDCDLEQTEIVMHAINSLEPLVYSKFYQTKTLYKKVSVRENNSVLYQGGKCIHTAIVTMLLWFVLCRFTVLPMSSIPLP
jgi:hypothetical protein